MTQLPWDTEDFSHLLPVDKWVYHLYAVRYMDDEGGKTLRVDRCVATAMSVEQAWDRAPGGCGWVEWEVIEQDVAGPLICGNYKGFPLYESGWETAERAPV